eukprot:scaffold116086_cov67-Cyclotella_meneghiniana.AAC.3
MEAGGRTAREREGDGDGQGRGRARVERSRQSYLPLYNIIFHKELAIVHVKIFLISNITDVRRLIRQGQVWVTARRKELAKRCSGQGVITGQNY